MTGAPQDCGSASVSPWPAPARVVLVRHGRTAANRDGRLSGRGGADLDLDPLGREQVGRAATALRALLGEDCLGSGAIPARLVTSSATRARRTGAIIAAACGLEGGTVQDDWDEQDYGQWSDRSVAQLIAEDAALMTRLRTEAHLPCPGGESFADVRARVTAAYRREVATGGTVVVATHRMAILAVLADVLDLDLTHAWRIGVAPASLTAIRAWPDGAVTVEALAEAAHLR